MDNQSRFWTTTKRRTLYLLLASAVLSVGTPAIVAATQPGARFYLRYPLSSARSLSPPCGCGAVAAVAFGASNQHGIRPRLGVVSGSVLFYVPVATGIIPTGGDMMAVGYVVLASGTLVAILAATVIAFAVVWPSQRASWQRRKTRSAHRCG